MRKPKSTALKNLLLNLKLARFSNENPEIEIQQIQNDRIRKAWEYMYSNNGKETKKLMVKAYLNSGESK